MPAAHHLLCIYLRLKSKEFCRLFWLGARFRAEQSLLYVCTCMICKCVGPRGCMSILKNVIVKKYILYMLVPCIYSLHCIFLHLLFILLYTSPRLLLSVIPNDTK